MIQEILPAKLNNTYRNRPASQNDTVMVFRGNSVLYKDTGFPTVSEYGPGKLTYLFSIDDIYYYLGTETEIPGYEYVTLRDIRERTSRHDCFAVMTAHHLEEWYRLHVYCGSCGDKLVHGENERMMYCPQCGAQYFPQISPAVIVGIIDGENMLVSRYNGRTAGYALIAGYTEIGETPEETVHREVFEETGLHVKNLRYYKSQPWGMSGSVLLGYFCELDGDSTIHVDHNELSLAEWKAREELPGDTEKLSLTAEMIQLFKDCGRDVLR